MRQEMEKTVLKGRDGGWSIWLSVAFGMVWLLLLPDSRRLGSGQ